MANLNVPNTVRRAVEILSPAVHFMRPPSVPETERRVSVLTFFSLPLSSLGRLRVVTLEFPLLSDCCPAKVASYVHTTGTSGKPTAACMKMKRN